MGPSALDSLVVVGQESLAAMAQEVMVVAAVAVQVEDCAVEVCRQAHEVEQVLERRWEERSQRQQQLCYSCAA